MVGALQAILPSRFHPLLRLLVRLLLAALIVGAPLLVAHSPEVVQDLLTFLPAVLSDLMQS